MRPDNRPAYLSKAAWQAEERELERAEERAQARALREDEDHIERARRTRGAHLSDRTLEYVGECVAWIREELQRREARQSIARRKAKAASEPSRSPARESAA